MMLRRLRSCMWITVLALHTALPAQVCSNTTCPEDDDRAPHLRFDVISIRSANPQEETWHMNWTPDGFSGRNVTLKALIQQAFGISEERQLIGGPAWIEKEKFVLEARVDDKDLDALRKANRAQKLMALKDALVHRFLLRTHFDDRQSSVLVMQINKGGSKLIPSAAPTAGQSQITLVAGNLPHLSIHRCTLEFLAQLLSSKLGQTVIDETGLSGRYDVKLDLEIPNGDVSLSSNDLAAAIISALRDELGLKLGGAKRPVPFLIIDSVSRPDAN